jgi:hypothetical protein
VIISGESLVSHAGGVLLVETARRSGLSGQLSRLLGRWRRPLAVHDPGKIMADLAIAVALGADAACDIAVLRAHPGVFGRVASDPTVSRLIATWPRTPTRPWPRSTPRGRRPGTGMGSRRPAGAGGPGGD